MLPTSQESTCSQQQHHRLDHLKSSRQRDFNSMLTLCISFRVFENVQLSYSPKGANKNYHFCTSTYDMSSLSLNLSKCYEQFRWSTCSSPNLSARDEQLGNLPTTTDSQHDGQFKVPQRSSFSCSCSFLYIL